jgi:hypothetical protein
MGQNECSPGTHWLREGNQTTCMDLNAGDRYWELGVQFPRRDLSWLPSRKTEP